MSYWNGARWVDDESPASASTPARIMSPRERRTRHVLGALTEGVMLSLIVVAMVSGTTMAGRGKGAGHQAVANAGCAVDGATVTGTGLPTDQVLNFMVTDGSGTTGWVLGWTDTGTWSEPVPARSGSTTYEFASKTWGPSGSKYTVFASCTAD
jgi:hypothetical protein